MLRKDKLTSPLDDNKLRDITCSSNFLKILSQKKQNSPHELSLAEELCLALVTGADQEEVITKIIRDNLRAKESEVKSLGFFQSQPVEIMMYILTFLSSFKDLLAVSLTSSAMNKIVNNYLTKIDMISILSQTPANEAMAIIKKFRQSSTYEALQKKYLMGQELTHGELLTYTLTTDNVATIDFLKLDAAIDELAKSNEAKVANPKLTNTSFAQYNSMNNLINSLRITSLAIKRGLLQQAGKNIDKKTYIIDDKIKRSEKEQELLHNFIIKNNLALFLLKAYRAKTQNNQARIRDIVQSLDADFISMITKIEFSKTKIFCNLAGTFLVGIQQNANDLFGINFENADLSNNYSFLRASNLSSAYLKKTNLSGDSLTNNTFDSNILSAKIENTIFISLYNGVTNERRIARLEALGKIFQDTNLNYGAIIAESIVADFKTNYFANRNYINPLPLIKQIKNLPFFNKQDTKSVFTKFKTLSGYEILTNFENEINNSQEYLQEIQKRETSRINTTNSNYYFL